MNSLIRTIVTCLLLSGLLLMIVPATTFANEPFPPCDASHDGEPWTDPQSGEKYICQLDPGNGFWYWHPVGNASQIRKNIGYTYQSSANGCAFNIVSIISDNFGAPTNGAGSGVLSRFFGGSPACKTAPWVQPAGELRARTVIQIWNGTTWVNVRDTGFIYSNVAASSWLIGFNMGGVPDAGAGTYRVIGYGSLFAASAWRGTSRTTAGILMQ